MEKAIHVDEGPIGKTLLAFALPVLAAQLLQELYNTADCAVLGHFGEPGALAATGIAGLLLSVFINFFHRLLLRRQRSDRKALRRGQ